MNQVSEQMKTMITGSGSEDPATLGTPAKNSMHGKMADAVKSQFFLSDEEIDNIREHIRKKHRTNTTRLLILYGLLLILLISFFSYYDIYS